MIKEEKRVYETITKWQECPFCEKEELKQYEQIYNNTVSILYHCGREAPG
jgi:hypothetical protein